MDIFNDPYILEALRPESVELRKAYWKLEAAREVIKVCDESPLLNVQEVLGSKSYIPSEIPVTKRIRVGCFTTDSKTDGSGDAADSIKQPNIDNKGNLKAPQAKIEKKKPFLRRLSSPFRKLRKSFLSTTKNA
ncbi:hypothetical protein ScPMuIL_011406 [Solemya velum]